MNIVNQQQTALLALADEARHSRQRRLAVLSGQLPWAKEQIQACCQHKQFERSLWVCNDATVAPRVINNKQARQFLGAEIQLLVYDVYSGFDPDAIAALSGALCAGGLLILIVPALDEWVQRVDPDYQRLQVYPFECQQLSRRFIEHIKNTVLCARSTLLIEQYQPAHYTHPPAPALFESAPRPLDKPLSPACRTSGHGRSGHHSQPEAHDDSEHDNQTRAHDRCGNHGQPGVYDNVGDYCRTEDQVRAVRAIVKVATGRRHRPLVITSDRGRGKSAALGIASALLLQRCGRSVIVTAPASHCVQSVFKHAANQLNLPFNNTLTLHYRQCSLTFIAPDQLLKQTPETDLLLIDEAAAIPVALSEQMLRRYSRVVFSTTIHGYEGTGRGFAIRFRQHLNALTPQWKSLSLSEPIRWAADDPVERWLFDALLMDAAKTRNIDPTTVDLNQCIIETVNRDQLLSAPQTLRSLFALLINAHYQTTPSDLRNLLDGPNITLWVIRYREHIIGAALVTDEGGFDAALAKAVWKGQRRVRGHLLPQTLAAHGGWQQVPELSCRRIMRIAIEPALQRTGLGTRLLQAIIRQGRQDNSDLIGASFAATADVLAFWRNNHCVPVRVGTNNDTCSGVPSAVVLCALSAPAQHMLTQIHERFIEQFRYSLNVIYQDLSAESVVEFLYGSVSTKQCHTLLTQQDWLDINAFATGHRQYESCLLALHKLVCTGLGCAEIAANISAVHKDLLIKTVLQHQTNQHVTQALQLTGKKQLITLLRHAVANMANLLTDSSS